MAGRVAHRARGHRLPAARDVTEAIRARRLQRHNGAERRERGAAAIRLLEHEPRLPVAPRRAHHRGRVDGRIDGHCVRGPHGPAVAPRAARGRLQARTEASTGLPVELDYPLMRQR